MGQNRAHVFHRYTTDIRLPQRAPAGLIQSVPETGATAPKREKEGRKSEQHIAKNYNGTTCSTIICWPWLS